MPAPGAKTFTATRPSTSAKRGQHLEIDQRLERDAPDLRHIRHAGDPMHDRAENDRRDQDADRPDERIAERLHPHAGIGIEVAERDAEHHRHEHQKPKLQVERLRALALDRAGRDCLIHVGPRRHARTVVARRFITLRFIRSGSPCAMSAKRARPLPAGRTAPAASLYFTGRDARQQWPASGLVLRHHTRPIYPGRYNRA